VAAVPGTPELRRHGTAQAPLSPAQRRLWFLHQLHPGLYAYHLPLAYRLDGPLDISALRDAITQVMSRHEVLRARIVAGPDGMPVQVAGAARPVLLPVTEVTEVTPELLRERLRVPFDLARGPLLRAELFGVGSQRHVLLIVVHHLVADEWTMSVLTAELSAAYSARVAGHSPALAELPLQYSDYAMWQQEALSDAMTASELAYWTRQLAGSSPLALPTDRPRPAVLSFAGRRACAQVPAELMERLRAVGRGVGATDFMIMAAALQVLLSRYTGQEDVTVGIATADRQRPGLDRLAGFFVNTVVLRTDLSGDPSFAVALERVREVALQAYEHQNLPFERLVEKMAPDRDMSRSPLFEVALSYLNTPPVDLRLEGLSTRELSFDPGTVRFDLDVFMRDRDGGVAVEVCYRTDLFDEPTIRRLLDHFLRLLGSAANQPQAPISALSLCGPDELGELRKLGSRPVTRPEGRLVHELVADWAYRQPDAPAVTDARQTLTYGRLDAMANRLAAHLRDRGAGRDTLVGILLERSAEFVVALLAVLKAGAAYLPLDPGYPDGRLADMLADSRAPIVVTTCGLAGRLACPPEAVLRLDRDLDLSGAGPGTNSGQARAVAPGDLAYVIYTSGSTGRPKGVLIEHRGLLNLCHWHIREYAVTRADRGTLVAAQGFDASVWELWPYLAAGASVSVADENTRSDPELLTRWLIDQRATLSFLATPLAEEVLKSELADQLPVRAILTGGDQLRQRPRLGLPFVLVNHYGPTECTVVATAGPVTASASDLGPPPIGGPIDNMEVYLLGEHQAPVPRGVRGELYLGGVQLARGYLGRPELTAERFVPHPAGPPGSRLYRTGDLARWRSDGQLEFLGRADRQIKIRGHRIEPGEIEARLRVHPAVAEALVVAYGGSTGRLIGYVIAAAGQRPAPDELRRWLRQWLPGYMIPAQFLTLPEFPMTASGKVDRSRLPAPQDEVPELAYAAPRDEVECAIAELFQKVLGRDRVGIYDDFFSLGGHSLLATRLIASLRREFGVDLPMRAIFDGPTVADLAVALVETAVAPPALAAPAESADAALPLPSAYDSSSS
ncbi:MAG TPA: amino acid adenylation domain-containing protein, partial [Trebonia sp.]